MADAVPTDPEFTDVLHALTDVIRSAATPEVQQAQALLLRRLALEGSVIPSRIPAPRNITEIGGYLNLLETLGMQDMRTQLLGAALGVAGSPLPGWESTAPPLPLVSIVNDRPDGAAAAGIQLAVTARADLVAPLQAALKQVHDADGLLPLWAPPVALPPANPGSVTPPPADALPYLGRALHVSPLAALRAPATDPVVLGRTAADPGMAVRLAVRVAGGTPGATPADWTAVAVDPATGAVTDVPLGTVSLLPLATLLAPTGWTDAGPVPRPTGPADLAWASLRNTTGLLPGVSTLGAELALSHPPGAIDASAFQGARGWVWDGATFIPPRG